ncbi:MAG: DUF4395 family protein [Anaerolineales bacterium]
MTKIRLPTPLRPYAEGRVEVEVEGASVGAALEELTRQYPGLRPHLYADGGGLRAYVNVFRNEDDVRTLQGEATPLRDADRLLIVPSIAGGAGSATRPVDYSALRTNQALIISLVILGFVTDQPWIAAAVGVVMLLGSLLGRPGFILVYRGLRAAGLVRPDPVRDHAQPHVFAQGFGGAVLGVAWLSLVAGTPTLGWALAWVVVGLAALNLFGGFCVGCAMYYWFHRLRIPGFRVPPPPGAIPGRRPPAEA